MGSKGLALEPGAQANYINCGSGKNAYQALVIWSLQTLDSLICFATSSKSIAVALGL